MIAILGWGSLIWDLDDLAPKVIGSWQMRAGPMLPMEFSRISPKRKMGLVVCLDPEMGVPCHTHAIRSLRSDVSHAVEDLAARERTSQDQIGWVDETSYHSRLPDVANIIQNWCTRHGWTGAVWTDLSPNFAREQPAPFSVAAGVAYLKTLKGESLAEAHRYIEEAPETTQTPLRQALQADTWWAALRK